MKLSVIIHANIIVYFIFFLEYGVMCFMMMTRQDITVSKRKCFTNKLLWSIKVYALQHDTISFCLHAYINNEIVITCTLHVSVCSKWLYLPCNLSATEQADLAVQLQIFIQEAVLSNLSQDTDYTDWSITWFSSVSL